MKLKVNNKVYNVSNYFRDMRLTEFLRDELDLTGAKNACEMNACGACAVLMDDEVVKICHILVKAAEGKDILTI